MSLSTSFILIALVILVYVTLIEIFSVLFRITGLNKEKSVFQAISLLTNCGYTTSESEVIAKDKARRRIAVSAMITGYSFSVIIVSLLINVFLSLNVAELQSSLTIILVSLGVLIFLMILLRLPFFRNAFDKFIEKVAVKVLKRNENENVITQLDNYGKDAICEVVLNRIPDCLYNTSLAESQIKDNYKMNFLMFNRKGKVHDVTKDSIFQKGDILVIFGSYQNIKDLFLSKVKHVESLLDSTQNDFQNDIDLIENYGSDAMVEVTVNTIPDALKDKTLFESKIKENYKINVMMIKRNDKAVSINKDTKILVKDSVVVFGPYQSIKALFIISKQNIQ